MKKRDYRAEQLKLCYKSGLKNDIKHIRKIIGIPEKGFTNEQEALIWKNNLLKPPSNINDDNIEWYIKSLNQENDLNAIILSAASLSLFRKYEKRFKDSKWISTIKQLLLYPKSSKLIHLPEMFSFIESIDEFTGEPRLLIDPLIYTQQVDFTDAAFQKEYKNARKTIAIKNALRKSLEYKALKVGSNREKKSASDQLLKQFDTLPWMQTMFEVSNLATILENLDKQKYAPIIAKLDEAHLNFAPVIAARQEQLEAIQERYEKQIQLNEITREQAQTSYEDNIQALRDEWEKDDQTIAGKIIAKAQAELIKVDKKIKKQIKNEINSIPSRKRVKFA